MQFTSAARRFSAPPIVYSNFSRPQAAWLPMRSQRSRPARWASQARRRSASAAAAGAGASAAYRPARHTQGDKDAQNGWYRYDTQFAVPILNAKKAIDHYTVYGRTLLIRNDADGKSYLYDLLDVEKKKVISAASFSAKTHSEVFAPKPSDVSIPADGENIKQQLPLKAPTGRQKPPVLLMLLTRYLQTCFGGNKKIPVTVEVTGIFLVPRRGFEPRTPCLKGRCSTY